MSECEFDAMESANSIVEAVQNQNEHDLCLMIERGGIDLNIRDNVGRTVLFHAACRGNSAITKILLENGADSTLYDRNGNTPLHLTGHCDVIDLLVSYGADVHARYTSITSFISCLSLKTYIVICFRMSNLIYDLFV